MFLLLKKITASNWIQSAIFSLVSHVFKVVVSKHIEIKQSSVSITTEKNIISHFDIKADIVNIGYYFQ